MKLNDLLLKKEELPILHETCFQIPIHPKLLDDNIKINEDIAERCFDHLISNWVKDKELIRYYKKEGRDFNIEKKPNWEPLTREEENGLVTYFSISRDFGGGVHFNKGEYDCETTIPNGNIKFSEEKVKEFEFKKIGKYSKTFFIDMTMLIFFPEHFS